MNAMTTFLKGPSLGALEQGKIVSFEDSDGLVYKIAIADIVIGGNACVISGQMEIEKDTSFNVGFSKVEIESTLDGTFKKGKLVFP